MADIKVTSKQVVGIAIEDSKRLGDVCDMDDYDTQVDMFPYGADDNVVEVLVSGSISGWPPYSSGLFVSDAQQAMDTLPRIVRKIIYRYARWRLKK